MCRSAPVRWSPRPVNSYSLALRLPASWCAYSLRFVLRHGTRHLDPSRGYDRRPIGPANFAEYAWVMADNGQAMFTQVGWVWSSPGTGLTVGLPGPTGAPYLSAHTSVNQGDGDNLGQGGTFSFGPALTPGPHSRSTSPAEGCRTGTRRWSMAAGQCSGPRSSPVPRNGGPVQRAGAP